MELPPVLVDTYRRYKKETEVFVNWLASTARSTGTVDDVFVEDSNNTEAVATGRLKGKARKAAKAQATKSFEIPVKAFTKLAAAIVAKKINVPKPMVDILGDIIRARKECGQFYRNGRTGGTEDERRADDGHAFYITILEEVFTTLRSTFPKEVCRVQKAEETEQLANIFEHLDLEEPTETETKGNINSRPQLSKPRDTYTLKQSDEDIIIAIFCFFKDVTDIRLFVRRTWRQFKDGLITLETAALTMNSASSLIQRLNAEFIKTYPQFEDHERISKFVSKVYFPQYQQDRKSVESFYWAAYTDGNQTFSYFAVSCDHVETIIRIFVLIRAKLTSSMILTAGEVLLAKCLIQLRALSTIDNLDLFERDSVLKAINEVVKTRKIPSWAVFTVQIFWDTQRELGTEVGRRFLSAQSTVKWILRSCDEYLALEGIEELGEYHKQYRDIIAELSAQTEALLNDDIVQNFIDLGMWRGGKPPSWGPHFLLRHHPMLSGLFSQYLLSQFQSYAITMAGCQGTILSAAHFHNAAVHTELLPVQSKWIDMDWVVEQQGEEYIFVGARPTSREKFSRHCKLAFGMSVSQLAKNARCAEPRGIKENYRKLKYMSTYLEATWHCSGDVVQITRVAEDAGVLMDSLLTRSQNCKGAHKAKSSSKTDRRAPKMTPVEMFTAFREVLKKDELPLRFDMMQVYLRSLRMLRKIQNQVTSQAPLDYPSDKFLRGLGLTRCVVGILAELDGYLTCTNLQAVEAVKILDEFIEKEGHAEHSQAISRVPRMPGEDIPSSKEPSFDPPVEDYIPIHKRDGFFTIRIAGSVKALVFDGVI